MKKNGFTLVELLAVIVILGILSLIAVPNVVSIVENNRKDMMISDAKKIISLAKYQVNKDVTIREFTNSSCDTLNSECTFSVTNLDINNDIIIDPDGGNYDKNASYVKYYIDNSLVTYCIYLKSSQRTIGTETSCIKESQLDTDKVMDISE